MRKLIIAGTVLASICGGKAHSIEYSIKDCRDIDGQYLCYAGYLPAQTKNGKHLPIYIEADRPPLPKEVVKNISTSKNKKVGSWEKKKAETKNRYRISLKGREFIKEYEQLELCSYPDQAGYRTIGWGHKIIKGEKLPTCITYKKAQQLFNEDIAKAEAAINNNTKVKLKQHQVDALGSFAFNSGKTAFRNSTLLSLINKGSFSLAKKEFTRWVYVTKGKKKVKSRGLINRRKDEAVMFAHNTY